MDIRVLEYFLRVAELGSINKAAASLHLSQPALSRHVAALEHDLGNRLFARTRGGVHLTEAGRLLAERARPLLGQVALLKEQVGETASGQLSLGMPPAWLSLVTAPFVEAMHQAAPGIAMRVYEGVSNVLRDYMGARLLDMAVLPFTVDKLSGYRVEPVLREPMALVAAQRIGLGAELPVPIARLGGLDYVLPARSNTARTLLEHALARKGLRWRVAMETDNLALSLEAVRRGVGYSVVPVSAVCGTGAGAGLSWAPIRGMTVTWAVWLNMERTHASSVRQARGILDAAMKRAVAGRRWPGAELSGPG